jgi:WYL domain
MPKRLSILRHRLIINRLRAFPSSFDELNDYLRSVSVDGEDYTFHQRTFQREIQEIAAIYDTEITYNRAAGYYEVTAEPEHLDRFWETFDVHNSLIGPPSQYVIPEKRRALGTAHMHSLLHAIKNQCEISFTHQKYWEDEAAVTIRSTKPLALKEARGRWYLIAIDNKDGANKNLWP